MACTHRQVRSRARSVRRTLASAMLGLALAVTSFLGPTIPASADEVDSYAFYPGHPVYYTYGGTASGGTYGKCTGGYAIAGSDGTFILGSGCALITSDVRGTDRVFARVAFRRVSTLLAEYPPDDAFQIIIDPLTSRVPADGRVTGYMPTDGQVPGTLVGKMGAGSGWTEGRITGWVRWADTRAICTDAPAALGDAGGPVWRYDQYGLRAVGVVVLFNRETQSMCYLPIQQVLREWGAWLPVFGGNAYAFSDGELDARIPEVPDAANYSVPIEYIPTPLG